MWAEFWNLFKTKEPIDEIENSLFVDEFKNLTCENQMPCPKCNGAGFMNTSAYFDQGAVCFLKCSLCNGAGSVNDDSKINYTKIDKEVKNYNTSLSFDETKTLF